MDLLNDPATRPPWLFTSETAKIYALKRHADNREKRAAIEQTKCDAKLVTNVRIQPNDLRRAKILEQIDALDKDFKSADAALRVKITASKARLWELLFPKPGSFRPRAERGAKRTAQDEPEADSEA